MENIDEKIRNLLQKSLFLNEGKKIEILRFLENATTEEKNKLFEILSNEKIVLNYFLKNSFEKGGKIVSEKLGRAVLNVKSTIFKFKERTQNKADVEEYEDLFA